MSEGNPNIAQYAEGHRFGEAGGADPREARAKASPAWCVRDALRRIAACPDLDMSGKGEKLMQQIRMRVFKGKMNGGQILAAQKFIMAMQNYKAMDIVTNDISGKLVEKRIEAKATLADLVNESYEHDSGE